MRLESLCRYSVISLIYHVFDGLVKAPPSFAYRSVFLFQSGDEAVDHLLRPIKSQNLARKFEFPERMASAFRVKAVVFVLGAPMVVNRRSGEFRKYSNIVHSVFSTFFMGRVILGEHGAGHMKPVASSHVPHSRLVETGDFGEFEHLSHGLHAGLDRFRCGGSDSRKRSPNCNRRSIQADRAESYDLDSQQARGDVLCGLFARRAFCRNSF